ncbi:MAG: aldose 1-epimerase family protein [Chloroflexota bacterium]|nr:aldose 1-epimerase family protein [Chloroflexota bacterium]
MRLYDREWTRREIEARVGRIEQVGGVRRLQLTEGPEAGVELIQVRTGAGLSYYVSPARGLDISLAAFGDTPISWQSANGDVHPAYYDPRGLEWLRTAAGGLLMTCGFTQAGAAHIDMGKELGLHGRAHHTPAAHVAAQGAWDSDEYRIRVSGVVEECAIFDDHIRMTRVIESTLGINRLTITDTLENAGFAPAPLMLLYHINFGFPLLMEGTTFRFPSRKVEPREESTPLEGFTHWQLPDPGHQERVYLHSELQVDERGWASASVHNPHFPLAAGIGAQPLTVTLSWSTATLPRFVQWRMPGAGEHVLGIEPANCNVRGRAASRADGSLVTLEPGQSQRFELQLDVETGAD